MRVTLKVAGTRASLERAILEECRRLLDGVFRRAASGVRTAVGSVCESLIESTDEYASLLHGKLLGELGVPDVESRVTRILGAIKRGVVCTPDPVRVAGKRLRGGLSVGILRADFEDLLALSDASYISYPSGETIPWLDWLLTQGDRVIVAGYDAFFDLTGDERGRSRTGLALMKKGSGWSVPAEFAGTREENWLTRAFDLPAAESLLSAVIQREIERALS